MLFGLGEEDLGKVENAGQGEYQEEKILTLLTPIQELRRGAWE